jgi:hypothetical protein
VPREAYKNKSRTDIYFYILSPIEISRVVVEMRIGKNELEIMKTLDEFYQNTDTSYLHSYKGLKERVTGENKEEIRKFRRDLTDKIIDDMDEEVSSQIRYRISRGKTMGDMIKKLQNTNRSSFNQSINRLIEKGLIEPVFYLWEEKSIPLPGRRQTYSNWGFPFDFTGYKELKVTLKKQYSLTKLGREELNKRY